MKDVIALGTGREFDAIRELIAKWGDAATGIGDDAALLSIPRGEQVVVSTDASVENQHFRREWLTPQEIGYRAVTAALSDLAAMAAKPIAVLWSVNVPVAWRDSLPAVADGAGQAAVAAGARIVGGNLANGTELSITTTVIGSAFNALRRDGAQVGDRVYVTGQLGGPGRAVAAWQSGKQPEPAHRSRFARPAARIREARWLANAGATAGIDVSDGLAGDASHLAAASRVGLRLELDRLPLLGGASPTEAVVSGEEYELLLTGPELDTAEFLSLFGIPLTDVGEVIEGQGLGLYWKGSPTPLGSGHDHFAPQ